MQDEISELKKKIEELGNENAYLKKVIGDLNLKLQELQVGKSDQPSSGLPKITIDSTTAKQYASSEFGLQSSINAPNFITKDQAGKMLGDVVAILKRGNGLPIQASKSNAFGQVKFSPIPNGNYQISLEKKGYTFPLIDLVINGEMISSFEIRSI
ncbi:MAG TPA: hypothetical protein PK957_01080 [Candidatus Dojkabacteria bacterium]|nr:hypothetical protein [Candidatus Dojkabacteria bacterium]HQF36209.1 hypothetical protein [Candidatus Dojkabacteria bacterium]